MDGKKTMSALAKEAVSFGFSNAGPLSCATLRFLEEVRDMCRADRCQMYDRSWMCPPACSTLEESRTRASKFTWGVLVQTTGALEDAFDYETMERTGRVHSSRFHAYRQTLLQSYPGLLALGAGACSLCERCSYPSSPCTKPKDAVSSMEAYGLLVSEVCEKNGLPYYYGENTITYTGCYLLL